MVCLIESGWAIPKFLLFSLPDQIIQKVISSLIFSLSFSNPPSSHSKSLSKSGINGIMMAIFVLGEGGDGNYVEGRIIYYLQIHGHFWYCPMHGHLWQFLLFPVVIFVQDINGCTSRSKRKWEYQKWTQAEKPTFIHLLYLVMHSHLPLANQ